MTHAIPLIQGATAEQWEEAFRQTEQVFKNNKSRTWVMRVMADRLAYVMNGQQNTDSVIVMPVVCPKCGRVMLADHPCINCENRNR